MKHSKQPSLYGETVTSGGMNQRRQQIIRAGYQLIVDKGLEGFRTRDVAAKVGINTATLHYYFPTKETLIQGVVLYLIEELKQPLIAQRKEPLTASEKLRLEFRDVSVRIREAPDQLLVLNELAIRSWRDPAIARILAYLDEQWHGHLSSILKQGIAQGEFRSDLNVVQTASSIMTQLRGIGLQVKLHPEQMERLIKQMAAQTSHWVMRDKPSNK